MKTRLPNLLAPSSRLPAALFVLFLGAAAPVLASESNSPARTLAAAPAPTTELTAQILYQYLLAEIAGARGQSPIAVGAMTDLAMQTQDARIARRATEMALYSRNYKEALSAGRIWLAHEPESVEANQTMVSLLSGLGQTEELKTHLAKVLAQEPELAPDLLLRLNRLFARVGNKAEVQALIDQTTEPFLNLPEAHFARAQAAYAAEQPAKAISDLDHALALRPSWESAVLFKALLQQQQPGQVLATLEPFVRANPNASDARLAMARALVAEKRFTEARAQFELVKIKQPNNLDVQYALGLLALQLRDIAKAEQIFRELIEKNYPESNLLRTYLGQIAEDKQQPLVAADWYRQVTAGAQYQAAQNQAAVLYARAGKLDEALAVVRGMPASTDTEKAQRSIAEARLLSESRQYPEALQVLEQALSAQPTETDLIYETAMAADKTGDFPRMEMLLKKIIKQKPEHAHAYNALGYSLADRNIRLDEALQLIDKALSLTPDDPFILDSKGWVLFRRGDLSAAADALQRAYTRRPDPEIAAHLGEVLWAMGRQPEAKKLWADSRRDNPSNETLATTIKKFVP